MRRWVLVACLLLTIGAAFAQKNAEETRLPPPPERSMRERFDQPVASFGFGPASLLMYPDESVLFTTQARARFQRQQFIDQFWGTMARNCPEGTNPARDLFWTRVEEASSRFEEEALPGWIADRGRVFVLLGAPKTEEIVKARIGETDLDALLWTFESAPGVPERVAFRRDRSTWLFVDANPQAPATPNERWLLEPEQLGPLMPGLARHFRTSNACAMTAEQQAEAARDAWRQSLWQISERVLGGESSGVTNSVEPAWSFFPAEGGATFIWLRIPLAANAIPEGARLVAILRTEGATERYVGTDDFPFEVRSVSGGGVLAQAGRAIPPGRYAVAVGIAGADGTLAPLFAGEQLVVRVGSDSFRLASVVLAESVQPLQEGGGEGPFRFAGFEVVPRVGSVIRHGETFAIFYQVLGAQVDDQGKAALAITYQFHIKRGTQWVKAGRPIELPNAFGATQAWSADIVPQWPVADYKLEITIKDTRTQGTLNYEVPFSVASK